MLTSTYDPVCFQALSDLDDALTRFNQRRAADELESLGRLIATLDLTDSVGLTMAHRHFDMSEDERLVEWFEDQFAHLQPFDGNSVADAVPFAWVVDSRGERLRWRPVEFVLRDQFPPSSQPKLQRLQESSEALGALAEELVARNLHRVFGIALAHRDLPLAPGQILVESLNHCNRRLTFQAGSQEEYTNVTLIPTFWKFSDGPSGIMAEAWRHCLGH